MSKENDNARIEKHVLEKLATAPKGKNVKLQDITNHVIYAMKVTRGAKAAEMYTIVGRVLTRLKRAKKARYIGGPGCGWQLP